MPSIFNSEEERLAYLLSVNATQGIKELNTFINTATNAAEALQRLTKVTLEYSAVTDVSFNQARINLSKLATTYREAVAAGNSLSGLGTGGIGGTVPPIITKLKEIPKHANNARSALGSLAATFRHVLVGMLAFRVITFFLDITRGIEEATKAASDFYKSLVNIEIGIRAMRKAGMEVTLQKAVDAITELGKLFPAVSTPEITDALDNILLKTSQMGLSWESVISILKIATGVYAATGKEMGATSDAILNAMMSSQGRMTITLSENTTLQVTQLMLVAKARELEIKNIENGISKLTAEERARTVLAVILDQYAEKEKDFQSAMAATPYIVEAMTSAWTKFKTAVGLVFLLVESKIAPYMITLLDNLTLRVATLSKLLVYGLIGWIPSFVQGMAEGLKSMSALGGKATWDDYLKGFGEGFNKIWSGIDDLVAKAVSPENDIEKLFGALGENSGEAFADGFTEGQEEALSDFEQDIEQMALDMAREAEQAKIDLDRKLADIDTNYYRDQEQAAIEYERDVADINQDAAESRADAEAEYRENELKAENDYQRELQQLRDRFLFDLEDALRERDARQVLRIMRQYQLDKNNIVQDGVDQKTERQRQLAEELADIEIQRQRKLSDLARDAEYKRQKAVEDWELDRADAKLRFAQDREDEALRNKYKLQDLVDALTAQGLATQAGAEAIRQIMMTYFGPGGYTDQIYNYLIAQIRAATMIAGALGSITSGGSGLGANTNERFASGGAMIASRPTTAVFGEGGEPELAVFLPLSKIRNPTARISSMSGGSIGGKINLEVLLSPDLEARIIRQATDNVAATITRVQREK